MTRETAGVLLSSHSIRSPNRNIIPTSRLFTISHRFLFILKPRLHYTRLSNRLYKRFDNRFDNRVERTAVRSTGCQAGLYNRLKKPAVYTIQPVVKPVLQPVDNRLYRVNGA